MIQETHNTEWSSFDSTDENADFKKHSHWSDFDATDQTSALSGNSSRDRVGTPEMCSLPPYRSNAEKDAEFEAALAGFWARRNTSSLGIRAYIENNNNGGKKTKPVFDGIIPLEQEDNNINPFEEQYSPIAA